MRACLLLWLVLAVTHAEARPNVVLILADDLGWRDLGVTGSDFYETPHLDALFASGVHFERGYASCQVCSPTRASLLTGKSPARHGVTDWIGSPIGEAWKRNTPALPAGYADRLAAEEVTLAEALREAGYRTFFAGKWHLGEVGSHPTDHGFEINLGGHDRGGPPGGYFSPYANPLLEDGAPGEHLPLRLGRETADFVRDAAEQPFFAMLSFYSVHGPIQSTRERWEANRLQALAKPAPASRFAFDRTMPYRTVQDHPVYAGMVEVMDDAVGLVLAALRESGKAEETIVVFTSDNGGVSSGDGRATSNLPLRGGKGKQWEAGVRVPLGIAWPGEIEGNQVIEAPAISTDIYPTVLELCGLPSLPDQHVDGVSLAPAMRGEPSKERALFWHYPHYGNQGGEPSSMILEDGWKLIRYHEDGREELYHLPTDPGEQNDLADRDGWRVAELGKRLDAYLAETDAKLPWPNPNFDALKRATQLSRARTQGVRNEERNAASFLKAEWSPGEDWWGSEPPTSANQ